MQHKNAPPFTEGAFLFACRKLLEFPLASAEKVAQPFFCLAASVYGCYAGAAPVLCRADSKYLAAGGWAVTTPITVPEERRRKPGMIST